MAFDHGTDSPSQRACPDFRQNIFNKSELFKSGGRSIGLFAFYHNAVLVPRTYWIYCIAVFYHTFVLVPRTFWIVCIAAFYHNVVLHVGLNFELITLNFLPPSLSGSFPYSKNVLLNVRKYDTFF